MKKLFHYIIIFLIIYWCFNNINGCSVPKVAETPQIENEGHQCEGCTEPIEEVPQEVSENENAKISYQYLKEAIIKTAGVPKSFIELDKKIEIEGNNVIVTIYYSVTNDRNERVNRKCVGVHEFTSEGVLISVDLDDKEI